MFDQLVESRPRRERSTAQAIVSVVVHTAIIAASIQLTRAVAATMVASPRDTEMLLTRAPVHAMPHVASPSPAAAAAPAPAVSAMPVPIAVPTSIPSADRSRGFNPSRLGATGGVRGLSDIAGNAGVDSGAVFTQQEADDPVAYVDGPSPSYPAALRQTGIEGSVQLRFIVDTAGLAEPASIEVLRSTNRSFERAAIDAIRQSRFKAARVRGRKVRQVVDQGVRFVLH